MPKKQLDTALAQREVLEESPPLIVTDFQVHKNNNPSTPLSSGSQHEEKNHNSSSSGSDSDSDSDSDEEAFALEKALRLLSTGSAAPRTNETRAVRRQPATEDQSSGNYSSSSHLSNESGEPLLESSQSAQFEHEMAELARQGQPDAVSESRQLFQDQRCRADITYILDFLARDMLQIREYDILTRLKVEVCRIMDNFEGQLKTVPENVPIFDDAKAILLDEVRATLEYTGMMGDHYDNAKRAQDPSLGPDDTQLLRIHIEATQRLDRTTQALREFLIAFSSRITLPSDPHGRTVDCPTTTRTNDNLRTDMLDLYYNHQVSGMRQLMSKPIQGELIIEKVCFDDTLIGFSSRFRANRRKGFQIFVSAHPVPPGRFGPSTSPIVYSVHLTYPEQCKKSTIDFEWTHKGEEVRQGFIGAQLLSMDTILAPQDARHRFKDDLGRTFLFVGLKTDRGDFFLRAVHAHPEKELCSHDVLVKKHQSETSTIKLHF